MLVNVKRKSPVLKIFFLGLIIIALFSNTLAYASNDNQGIISDNKVLKSKVTKGLYGGEEVAYEDGITIHRQPPANWSPLTASDEELEYYSYPARPEDPKALELWTERSKNVHIITPEIGISSKHKELPKLSLTQAYSDNWAGYVLYKNSQHATGSYTIPSITTTSGKTPAYLSEWVGLGGSTGGSTLIQAGTEADLDSVNNPTYYAWYEIVGSSASMVQQKIPNLVVHANDIMWVEVWYTQSPTVAHFYVQNITSGVGVPVTVNIDSGFVAPTSSEWIVERTAYSPDGTILMYPYLPKWSSLKFSDPKYGTSYPTLTSLNGSESELYMKGMVDDIEKNPITLAYPLTLQYNSSRQMYEFGVNWSDYGTPRIF